MKLQLKRLSARSIGALTGDLLGAVDDRTEGLFAPAGLEQLHKRGIDGSADIG